MDDRVVIALFRHGLTEENKRRGYLGWTDSPLCPETQHLTTDRRYDCYFSSDLYRCIRTGKLLFPGAVPELLADFREMNFGKWERKTYEELKDDPLYRQWLADPLQHRPPDGESFQQFAGRVAKGWGKVRQKILDSHLHSSAIITHGGVIKHLLAAYAPEPRAFSSWQIPHGRGYELIFDREALRRNERCTLLQEVPLTENGHG